RYTAYNLAFAAIVLPLSYWLSGPAHRRWRSLSLSARIGALLTLVGYPWDFFAIQLGVWAYPSDPGWRLHSVPLNDVVFMWLCTHLACCVLLASTDRRQPPDDRHPECEDARQQ